jgi:ribonuclease E
VQLKDGGYLVIERTEALVSIDVNSGRYRREKSAEQTAFKTNLRAASEIARQLRLRDLGGLIICDFIDMRDQKHRKEVERTFRAAVKTDRAHYEILNISKFGLVEMTRQRLRSSAQEGSYRACKYCGGTGYVREHGSLSVEVVRMIRVSACDGRVCRVELRVSPAFATYMQNEAREALCQIEQASNTKITVCPDPDYAGEQYKVVCYDDRDRVVNV